MHLCGLGPLPSFETGVPELLLGAEIQFGRN